MPIDPLEPKVKITKKQIEDLKQEIRELFPGYQTRRLELGIKLLLLQEMLAHHGNGSFIKTVKLELKIPHTTAYELLKHAKEEIERLESLYGNRTNLGKKDAAVAKKLFGDDEDDATIDINNPAVVAFLLEKFEQEAQRDHDVEYLSNKPAIKDYPKKTYLNFVYPRETRLAVIEAWQLLKKHEGVMKEVSKTVAKEVVDAAAELKEVLNNQTGSRAA